MGNYGIIKFVRFSDGSYIFGTMNEQHIYIATGLGVPVSAGFLKCLKSKFEVSIDGSMTLNLGPSEEDEILLPPRADAMLVLVQSEYSECQKPL
jgi:hypothetical protein